MDLVQRIAASTNWMTLLLPGAVIASYGLAARTSLSTWIAVQALEDAPASSPELDASRLKRRRVLGALAGIAFLAAEIAVITSGNDKLINGFFMSLVSMIVAGSHFSLIANLLGFKRLVQRKQNGALAFSLDLASAWSKVGMAVAVLFAGSDTFLTVTQPGNKIMRTLTISALVVAMSSRSSAKVASLRKMVIFFLAYEAAVIALIVFLIYGSQTIPAIKDIMDSTPTPGLPSEAASPFSDRLSSMFSLLISAFYVAPVGHFAAIAMRFDYHQHKTSFTAPVVVLEQVPAPTRGCRKHHSAAIVVPTNVDTEDILPISARTYYNLIMSVASICYFIIAPTLHYAVKTYLLPVLGQSGQIESQHVEEQMFAILAMFITVPIVVVSLLLQAKLRGEKKELWTYVEHWHVKPGQSKPVQAAAQVGEKRPFLSSVAPNQGLLITFEDVNLEA